MSEQHQQTNSIRPSDSEPDIKTTTTIHSSDYAPYPKLQPDDVVPPSINSSDTWTSVSISSQPKSPPPDPTHDAPPPHQTHDTPPPYFEPRVPIAGDAATTMPAESNPYVSPSPASSSSKSEYDMLSF